MFLWALDYLRHGGIKHGLVAIAAFLGLLPADQGQSPGDALRPLQAGEDEQDEDEDGWGGGGGRRGGGAAAAAPVAAAAAVRGGGGRQQQAPFNDRRSLIGDRRAAARGLGDARRMEWS